MELLSDSAKNNGLRLDFGVATFRAPPGDILSSKILSESEGLGKFFNDPKLKFFTAARHKSEFALNPAKTYMEEKYSDELENVEVLLNMGISENGDVAIEPTILEKRMHRQDIIICDDQPKVYKDAEEHGYSAVCVDNLSKLEYVSQIARVAKTFKTIFEKLQLPVPPMPQESMMESDSDN